ncbi:MAG: cysteine desulfurase family protein [Armatimonadia bacterium]
MQRQAPVYLDCNATTRCAPQVVEAMLPFLTTEFGNAGSPHVMGRAAATAVAAAREAVAALAGCSPGQIIFTSGATESNNLALLGLARSNPGRRKIIVSAVEHKSILGPCDYLAEQGFQVVLLPVDRNASVDLEAAASLIDEKTLLVSVQGGNNEVGTVQPVAEIGELARRCGAFMHTDGAQVLGKVPLDLHALPVHLASFSAHKLYGPKGVGALYVRDGEMRSLLTPLQFGGGQEDGLRPGTLNVPGIVGFGRACRLCSADLASEPNRTAALRDRFEAELAGRLDCMAVNGTGAPRLPGTSSITIHGSASDLVISRASGICISQGSACGTGTLAPSHVLLAMGLPRAQAEQTIRLSFGRYNTAEDVSVAVGELATAVALTSTRP